jgi:seryl-tRNA synthetase
MLDLKYVVENLEEVREMLQKRGTEAKTSIETIAEKAEKRRIAIQRLQDLRTKQNQANALMAKLDKKSEAFAQQRDELKKIAAETKQLDSEHREIEAEITNLLLHVPNLPAESTPFGKDGTDNQLLRRWGTKPTFDFEPKDHTDLGLSLGIIDFERATKLSGARFSFLLGHGARMIRALMAFMVDLHSNEHGYTEIWSPVLVKDETLRGTGQLPKFANDLFRIDSSWDQNDENKGHDLYLIPTAEVPVTNFHSGEILEAEELPIANVAYTVCFRSEAGSYGKDTRGLIRQHQFDKVELVRVERPDEGEAALEKLTAHAEEVLKRLELHYQVVQLCSGDLGFGSRKTYDLEVWLPGQNAYREISSCSWCGDFQSRRANIRFRPAKGEKPKFVHTLNGSGLAIGRTFVAVLEQYQQADGTVRVPKALVPYMGGIETIKSIG